WYWTNRWLARRPMRHASRPISPPMALAPTSLRPWPAKAAPERSRILAEQTTSPGTLPEWRSIFLIDREPRVREGLATLVGHQVVSLIPHACHARDVLPRLNGDHVAGHERVAALGHQVRRIGMAQT